MTGWLHNVSNEARVAAFRFAFATFALFAVVSTTVLAGCSDKEPVVDQNLVAAFVEVRMIEQAYGAEAPMARLARQATLKKYGYTTETFTQACDAVLNDDAMWVPFQRTVTERIDSLLGIPKPVKEKKKGDKK